MTALAHRPPARHHVRGRAPGAAPTTLPRMDVAAFVGFAAAGPLDVPVAVEDAARFRDVFGADLRPRARRGRRARSRSAGSAPPSGASSPTAAGAAGSCASPSATRSRPRASACAACSARRRSLPRGGSAASTPARAGAGPTSCASSALLRSRPLAPRAARADRRTAWRWSPPTGSCPATCCASRPPAAPRRYAPVASIAREPGGPRALWTAPVVAAPAQPSGELACAFRIGLEEQTPIDAAASDGELLLPATERVAPGELIRAERLVVLVGAPVPARAGDGKGQARFAIAGAWTLGDDAPAGDALTVERLTIDLLVWRDDAVVARLADLGLRARPPALLARPARTTTRSSARSRTCPERARRARRPASSPTCACPPRCGRRRGCRASRSPRRPTDAAWLPLGPGDGARRVRRRRSGRLAPERRRARGR